MKIFYQLNDGTTTKSATSILRGVMKNPVAVMTREESHTSAMLAELKEEKEMTANSLIKRASAPVSLCNIKDTHNQLVKGYMGVFNERENKVVSVVSDEYKLLPNKLVLDPVLEFLDKKRVKYKLDRFSFVTDQRMRVHFTFPDIRIKDDTKDGILSSMFLHNSYNMLEAFRMTSGAMRLVCSNGMVVGTVLKKIKIIHQAHHIQDIATVNIESVLKGFYDNVPLIEKRIRELRDGHATVKFMQDVLSKFDMRTASYIFRELGLMHEEDKNELAKEVMGEMTEKMAKQIQLWQLYNILTKFVSHQILNRYRVDYLQRISKLFEL